MSAATSGVCIVRIETQDSGVLLTVTTEYFDGSSSPCSRRLVDIAAATTLVYDFLASFQPGGRRMHPR
jgi:hypothetical protein